MTTRTFIILVGMLGCAPWANAQGIRVSAAYILPAAAGPGFRCDADGTQASDIIKLLQEWGKKDAITKLPSLLPPALPAELFEHPAAGAKIRYWFREQHIEGVCQLICGITKVGPVHHTDGCTPNQHAGCNEAPGNGSYTTTDQQGRFDARGVEPIPGTDLQMVCVMATHRRPAATRVSWNIWQ